MLAVHPNYITNRAGKKISVILPIKEYKTMVEELEELEDIRLFDEAKKRKEVSIPIDDAFKTIEKKRAKRK